jgi:hypothetical protein
VEEFLQFLIEDPMSVCPASDVVFNRRKGQFAGDRIRTDHDLERFQPLSSDERRLLIGYPVRHDNLDQEGSVGGSANDVGLVPFKPLFGSDVGQFDLRGINRTMAVARR